jgi:hypothetical protein
MTLVSGAELPTLHCLRAARLVGLFLVQAESPTRALARQAYRRLPSDGVFAFRDFVAGEDALIAESLVRLDRGRLVVTDSLCTLVDLSDDSFCRAVLTKFLDATRPLWILAAAGDSFAPENIPDDAAGSLRLLYPDPIEREAFLLKLGRRHSEEELREVGELAECHVETEARTQLIFEGRGDLAQRVRRVSLLSDELGYDVTAPRLDGSDRRLEVKGTRGEGSVVRVVISRNEATVGLRDPAWTLVVCRVGRDKTVSTLGWTAGSEIANQLPSDPETGGKWDSATLYLDVQALKPSLPSC